MHKPVHAGSLPIVWETITQNKILRGLIRAGTNGMTRTGIVVHVFNYHVSSEELDSAFEILARSGLVKLKLELNSQNQKIERWFYKKKP
jgi:hypothetical protein